MRRVRPKTVTREQTQPVTAPVANGGCDNHTWAEVWSAEPRCVVSTVCKGSQILLNDLTAGSREQFFDISKLVHQITSACCLLC